MRNYRIIFTLLCCLPFIGCGDGDDEPSRGPKPTLSMTIASSGANSVTLNMRRTNASSVKIIHKATGVITSETAQSVAQNGTQYTGTTVEIDGLAAQTTYTVFAVACNDSGEYSQMQHVRFTTDAPGPQMYPWEQSRSGILSYTDMVLCYGGSHHRTPYRWDKERFTPFVTYVDESGREHWLFDGFLCLEFQDSSRPDGGKYAYMVGVLRGQGVSAGKQQWKELIDYWFDGDNGEYSLLLGKAKGIDGPYTKGTYLWIEVENWKRLEAKLVEGPYIHHCVGIHKDVVPVLYEACKYMKVKPDLYDGNEEAVKAYLRGE